MSPTPVSPSDGRSSQAAYNFVRLTDAPYLPNSELPKHDRYVKEHLSGRIDIKLVAATWLYTRAAIPPESVIEDPAEARKASWQQGDRAYRHFFHHGTPAEPVVPGSSLRGMLRQMVEVLSDGRLLSAPLDPLVYRAVADPNRFGSDYRTRFVGLRDPISGALQYPMKLVRGGYLYEQDREWFIQPATEEVRGESFVRFADNKDEGKSTLQLSLRPHNRAHKVWVKPATRTGHRHHGGKLILEDPRTDEAPIPRSSVPHAGWVKGNLIKTEIVKGVANPKHMHLVVYEPDGKADAKCVPPAIRNAYLRDRDEVQRDARHPGRAIYPPHRAVGATAPEDCPCLYLVDDNDEIVFFGPTAFFRLPYVRSPAKFQNLDENALDLPERLFGTARTRVDPVDGRLPSVKGRLRFEDLTWDLEGGDPFVGDYFTREPLLAPKPACIQHYLTQRSDDRKQLLHYDDAPWPEGSLRGFKHYWHRSNGDDPSRVAKQHLSEIGSEPVEHVNVAVGLRPVREGTTFRGRIYFDNLTQEELGALLTAVKLPADQKHKLGMARPFGLGSTRIEVEALHVLDPKRRYDQIFVPAGSDSGDNCLEPGWRNDPNLVETSSRQAFLLALVRHRLQESDFNHAPEELERLYWSDPRMTELAALLSWDDRPPHEATAPVSVQGPGFEQWRHRKILPPATDLVPSTQVSRPIELPETTNKLSANIASLVAGEAGNSTQSKTRPPRAIKTDQTRSGTLLVNSAGVSAKIEGPNGIETGTITNPASIPTPADGAQASFKILSWDAYSGRRAEWLPNQIP